VSHASAEHALQAEVDELQWQKRAAQDQLQEAVTEIAQLRADLERVKAERDDLRAESETHICRLEDELADTKAALEARAGYDTWMRTAKALGAELDQLQLAWALRLLERNWIKPEHLDLPESVATLIRAGAGCLIGECDNCKQRAPLLEWDDEGRSGQSCAPGWPCKP
jgi:hypothetical protein